MLVASAALAVGLAAPAGAAAKSGLGCLSGSWVSNKVSNSSVSGLAGVKLNISGGGSATANYAFSGPLHFPGSAYIVYVRGSSSGKFHFKHGHYSYSTGANSMNLSVFLGSKRLKGPTPATSSEVPRYPGLSCSSKKLTTHLTVATKSGSVDVAITYHRA